MKWKVKILEFPIARGDAELRFLLAALADIEIENGKHDGVMTFVRKGIVFVIKIAAHLGADFYMRK